jgi:hypothetical protein
MLNTIQPFIRGTDAPIVKNVRRFGVRGLVHSRQSASGARAVSKRFQRFSVCLRGVAGGQSGDRGTADASYRQRQR